MARTRKFRLTSYPGLSLLVVLVGIIAFALGWSNLFALRAVNVQAAGDASAINYVQQSIVSRDVLPGQPLARVNIERVSRDLVNEDWIAHAKVSRNWLSRALEITVTPKRAVATFVGTDGNTHYLTAQGQTFSSPIDEGSLPSITLVSPSMESEDQAARIVSQIPATLLASMKSLSIDSAGNAQMVTSLKGFPSLTVLWGTSDSVALKVRDLYSLLAMPENKKITSVNLTDPLSPVVK